jgi:predicted DCC family thiol-disulfide oxidoreductase YuxK
MTSGASGESLRIFYDGDCPLCRAEIDHYRNCDGADQLAFVDVRRSRSAPALAPGLTREAALRRFHVRTADGRLVSGAEAFGHLWRILPGWRWLGRLIGLRILGLRPVLAIAEAAYRLSLPLRPRLARWVARRDAQQRR